ncbi:MAG: hypothetical protein L3K18_00680 [Thermoplasmata archaeon]|nr:hypothetical protein [Thermoplasmata archaeon]MCI4355646.1 hypothetical protein [Thermoplasmata archaeon]
MSAAIDLPRRPRGRRFWLVLGSVVAAISVVGVVAILAEFEVPPFCSIPGGSSGRECVNGVHYQFETVQVPIGPHSSVVDVFAGDTFTLSDFSNNASYGLLVNMSDTAGPHGTVELVSCCLSGVGAWQTALGPGGTFGAQAPGENLGQVRLMVRA